MAESTTGLVKKSTTWSIVWGVLLVIFGFLAIDSPFIAAMAFSVIIAWLIIFAGVVHLAVAFHAHGAGSKIWKILVGLAYIAFGIYLLMRPGIGVLSLTLILAILFLVEGVLDLMLYFRMRRESGSVWILIDAIVTLLLGGLIYVHWPSSSVWAIGTLVGVSMIMSGFSRIMLSMAVRRVATA
jgi:uncharacterized membrane protein HdeD (DUF308 family)